MTALPIFKVKPTSSNSWDTPLISVSIYLRLPRIVAMEFFSGTNDLVEKLTGQKPLQLVNYITKHKAAFTLADKTRTK
jgi:hypothetical protein